ncbi:MAG TPA: hypothetical protein VEB66_13905 [Opitutaceae bacterium]|nr:hypothetical protein [Opitutaceae bacterium]
MNKIYVIVPLIGLLLFGGYFWNFNKGYKLKEQQKREAVEKAVRDKAIEDEKNRRIAYDNAIKAQEQRKREKEERDRIEEEKKKQRQDLEDKRERSFNERKKFREQVDRLKKEVAEVDDQIKDVEAEKKSHADEQVFLKNYVKQAESNVKYYYDLLDKIDAAEKARAAAEAAAAAAKKNG